MKLFNLKIDILTLKNIALRKRTVALISIISAVFLSIYTYLDITRNDGVLGPDTKSSIYLILFDVILLFTISGIIFVELFKIWNNKKSGAKRSHLKSKIIFIFSLIASIPTIIIALFSVLFFYNGIQSWFNQRINTAFSESFEVAKAYQREHVKLIEADTARLAQQLNYIIFSDQQSIKNAGSPIDREFYSDYLSSESADKNFIEAAIFTDKPFRILAKNNYGFTQLNDKNYKSALIEAGDKNNIVIINDIDKVTAITKLDNFPGRTFLLVKRLIDSNVIEHLKKTRDAYSEYQGLNSNISQKQIEFSLSFLIISLILVLSAIWTGIFLASAMINPLLSLIEATEKIKEGNLSIRVKEGPKNDEISDLSRAFNLMTAKLESQRHNLMLANKQIDARRHFSETVISGVSAGIIALDMNKKISIMNPQARSILSISEKDLKKNNFQILCPELYDLLDKLPVSQEESINAQINIERNNKSVVLFVRVISEILDKKTLGYIITFDDISELILAQRTAAWSDVARRIAHEIKNPLTPIHLASQRLQKKYSMEVSDSATFTKYIDTIMKHVTQIGRMVEEFVNFARMPDPKFSRVNIISIAKDIIFSRECLENKIEYITSFPTTPILINCDGEQIFQVLLNIIKNAEESLENDNKIITKRIEVAISKTANYVIISIEDNGSGFSPDLFDKVSQPYVTSKNTGTGLGLAIVKKIMDDHNAIIKFSNRESGGASIKLMFIDQPNINQDKNDEA